MSEPAWVPIGPAAVLDVGPEVAYQEITSAVSLTATSEATSQAVLTAPAFVADGTSQYLIEFFAPSVSPPGTSGQFVILSLYQDGVCLGQLGVVQNNGANPIATPSRLTRRITPAAGSRTYSIRGFVSSGTGSVNGGAGGVGGNLPAFIRITKVPSAVPGPSGLVPPTAIGTALPASPVDGQEFILTDSLTAPTYSWRFRYLAAKTSNKWLCVGGAAAVSLVDATETTGSTSPTDLATFGPSIAIPVAGDYHIAWGGSLDGTTAIIASMSVGGASVNLGVSSSGQGTACAKERRVSLAAGALTCKYNSSVGGQLAYFSQRYLAVTPIAIGG